MAGTRNFALRPSGDYQRSTTNRQPEEAHMDNKRASLGAEAQMRRAESFWRSFHQARVRALSLRLREMNRRDLIKDEFQRMEGPRAPVLRALERAADSAHDRRLFELEKMKTLARSARGAEMQAKFFYEEADGR